MNTTRTSRPVPALVPVTTVAEGGEPEVSVVITCYNYARFVDQAMRSVLDQEGVDLELIVVDDVSQDDSLAVIRDVAAGDARVRVVAREYNGGAARAFNDGLARVRGRAWVRLDADDVLTPGSLRRGLDVLDAEPAVVLVYGGVIVGVEGQEWPTPRTEASSWSVWRGRDWLEGRLRDPRSVIASVEVMVRTAATDEVGPMVPLRNAHDFELWLRIATRWEVARIDGADQGVHRVHGESLSTRHIHDTLLGHHKVVLVFRALLASEHLRPEERAAMTATVEPALVAAGLDVVTHQWDRGAIDSAKLAAVVREVCAGVQHVAERPGDWAPGGAPEEQGNAVEERVRSGGGSRSGAGDEARAGVGAGAGDEAGLPVLAPVIAQGRGTASVMSEVVLPGAQARAARRYRAATLRLAANRTHPVWRATSFVAAAKRRVRYELELAVHARTGVHNLWAVSRRDTVAAVQPEEWPGAGQEVRAGVQTMVRSEHVAEATVGASGSASGAVSGAEASVPARAAASASEADRSAAETSVATETPAGASRLMSR